MNKNGGKNKMNNSKKNNENAPRDVIKRSMVKADSAITLIAFVINAKWRHYRRTRRRLTARRDKKHSKEQNPYWNLSKFYLIL